MAAERAKITPIEPGTYLEGLLRAEAVQERACSETEAAGPVQKPEVEDFVEPSLAGKDDSVVEYTAKTDNRQRIKLR